MKVPTTRSGDASLYRRISPALIALALTSAACGSSQAATVRTAPEEGYSSDTIGASDAIGSDLDDEALSRIGFDETARSELPEIQSPLDAASTQAAASGEALIRAFVDAVAVNDLDRAATFTTGPANQFLFYLKTAQECGFAFETATSGGVTGEASLSGVGRLELPVDATLTLDSGVDRPIEAIQIENQKQAGWLISDFFINGNNATGLMTELDSSRRKEVRMTPQRLCTGPTKIDASYLLHNERRDPLLPVELYFLDASGVRHEVDGAEEELAEPVPGRAEVLWEFSVELDNAYNGGQFILVARDFEEAQNGDTELLVVRDFPVQASPFFSDLDEIALIDGALGQTSNEQPSDGAATTSTEDGGGDTIADPESEASPTTSTPTTIP